MKHKKVILLILGLMLSLCLFFGISYAFWLKENTQDIKNIANSGCFNLSLTEETSAININNLYPIKDEESTNLTPYTFTLKNTCNYNAYYEINLETLADTNIDLKFLKASLNNNNPKLISEFPKTSNIINNAVSSNKLLSGYLSPGKSATYCLRIWMSYDTTLDDVRNDGTDMWQGKITIKSSYVSNDALELVCVNAGGDMITDGECRKYYVKLNNLSNPYSSNGYELIKNEDNSYTASTENLNESTNTGPIRIMISKNAFISSNKYYNSIDILSMLKRFEDKKGNALEVTKYTYYNNQESWPRLNVIQSLNNTGHYSSLFTANIPAEQVYLESYSWTEFTFKNSLLTNLTLMFGEGHEPDKEWCDKYLTEFIEYNKEGTLIPIKEIGTTVPTAYYETISLTK